MTESDKIRKKSFLNEHFTYEVEMIMAASHLYSYAQTAFVLNQIDQMKFTEYKNIALENMLMHSRNLVEFFYYKRDKDGQRACAEDYVSDWKEQMTEEIKKFNNRVNDEITHLGWRRLDVEPATKGWDLNKLAYDILTSASKFIGEVRKTEYYDFGIKQLEFLLYSTPV